MSLKFILRRRTTMADQPSPEALEDSHSLSEPIKSLEQKLEELKSTFAMWEPKTMAEMKGVSVCEECKEMRDRETRLKVREDDLSVFSRKVEEEFVACCEELEFMKGEMVESRRAQSEEIGGKLRELDERWRCLEAKDREVKAGFEALGAKEREVKAGFEALGAKERDVRACLEAKERDIEEGFEGLESKQREVKDGFEAKERDFIQDKEGGDAWRALPLKKREMSGGFRAMGPEKRVKLREQESQETDDGLGVLEMKVARLEVYSKGFERKQCQTMDLRKKELDEGFEVIEAKKKELDEWRKELEKKETDIIEWHEQMETKESEISEWRKEMEMKESEISEWRKEMELKESGINEWRKELELKESDINDRCKEVVEKENRVNRIGLALKSREKSFNERSQAQATKDKEFDEKWKDMEMKEKEITERTRALELTEKQLDQRCENLNSREKDLMSLCKANAAAEKELEEKLKAVESKEKQLNEKVLGIDVRESEDKIVALCNAMSGKTLQMYLSTRFLEHQLMKERLSYALTVSNDPARLVLSAIDGFFPPHIESSAGLVFDTKVVRTSCLALLENLMNMKSAVSEAVRNEALKVANQWRDGIMAEGASSVVVLGFLMLLAAYNLGPNFVTTELQRFYEVIDQHRLGPQISLKLGLSRSKNDGNKRSSTCTESPAQDKRLRVDTDQPASHPPLLPNPTDAFYGYPPNFPPFQYQYSVWPPGTAPAACSCIPPYWCSWCRPSQYPYPHFPQ